RHANVIAEALAHAALAVEAAQDRQRHANLRFLPGVPLQIASDHQAEKLLTAAELDIGPDLHAVVTLHERVQTPVHVDGRAGLQTLGEVIALQHALHGNLAGQVENVEKREAAKPFPVVADDRLGNVDDLANLFEVIARVGLHLLHGQVGARLIAAARIAD